MSHFTRHVIGVMIVLASVVATELARAECPSVLRPQRMAEHTMPLHLERVMDRFFGMLQRRLTPEQQQMLAIHGGGVIDWVIGRTPRDIDLTILVPRLPIEDDTAVRLVVEARFLLAQVLDTDPRDLRFEGIPIDITPFVDQTGQSGPTLGLTIKQVRLRIDGTVLDPYDGSEDIVHRVARIDPRVEVAYNLYDILLVIRDKLRYQLEFDPETEELIKGYWQGVYLAQAVPRGFDTEEGLAYFQAAVLRGIHPRALLDELDRLGLLDGIDRPSPGRQAFVEGVRRLIGWSAGDVQRLSRRGTVARFLAAHPQFRDQGLMRVEDLPDGTVKQFLRYLGQFPELLGRVALHGGAVYDLMRGISDPHDLDLAVILAGGAPVDAVMEELVKALNGWQGAHAEVGLHLSQEGHLVQVNFGAGLGLSVKRMSLVPEAGGTVKILDPAGGIRDAQTGVARHIEAIAYGSLHALYDLLVIIRDKIRYGLVFAPETITYIEAYFKTAPSIVLLESVMLRGQPTIGTADLGLDPAALLRGVMPEEVVSELGQLGLLWQLKFLPPADRALLSQILPSLVDSIAPAPSSLDAAGEVGRSLRQAL